VQPTRSRSTPLSYPKGKELEEKKKLIIILELKHVQREHLIYIMEYKEYKKYRSTSAC
jgi:hypothetical protein